MKPNLIPRICKICGKKYSRKRNKRTNKLESLFNFKKRQFCSRECYWNFLKTYIKGENNPHWQNGRSSNKEYLLQYKRNLYRKYHPLLSKEELWKKRSESNKGRHHSEETKRKIGLAKLKNPTKYWLNKRRPEMRKEIKSRWKEFRKQLRERTEYQQWIREIFKQDNWTCQVCKIRGNYLEAHHLLAAKEFPQYILNIDNGITLCRNCHKELNGTDKQELSKFRQTS